MKKFMSAATVAALTLSALCVPVSMVSAADEKVQDSFGAYLQDVTLKKGETTVKIPMCFDKDVNFTIINAKFSTAMLPTGAFTSEIESVESAISDAAVASQPGSAGNSIVFNTANGKDYTIKAGTPVAYVNVVIKDRKGEPAVNIGAGATFKVNVDELDIVDENRVSYEFSSEALSRAKGVIQIVDGTTEGMEVKFESVTAESRTVEVPVYLTGKMCAFRTELKADNGAVVTAINSDLEGLTPGSSASMVFADMNDDQTFENTKIATATVKLPANASKGDKFTVTVKYFDAATMADDILYPSAITTGIITCGEIAGGIADDLNGLRGDINLDGAVNALDMSFIANYANGLVFGENTLVDYFKESTLASHKEYVEKYGVDAVAEYAVSLGDADKDGEVKASDMSAVANYANASMFGDPVKWEDLGYAP